MICHLPMFILGYPSSLSNDTVPYEQTFDHLCEDVRAGADFIITQMVFEASDFLTFVDKCNSNGITVPIIPGVLPIQVCTEFICNTLKTNFHGKKLRNFAIFCSDT